MTFTDDLNKVPFRARKQDAEGFLPPLLRASGHLLFTLASVADEDATPNDEELLEELNHAKGHWDALNHNEALSPPTAETVENFGAALTSAIAEWPEWEQKTRVRNLRDLSNRIVGIAVTLDRELVGLTASDAGNQL